MEDLARLWTRLLSAADRCVLCSWISAGFYSPHFPLHKSRPLVHVQDRFERDRSAVVADSGCERGSRGSG